MCDSGVGACLVQCMEADLCLLSHSQLLFIRHVNILSRFICEAALPLLPISISGLTQGLWRRIPPPGQSKTISSSEMFSSSLLHTAPSVLWPLNVHSQLTWLSDDLFGYLTTSHQIRDCMSSTTSSTHFPHHQCSVCLGISWSSFFGLWSQSHDLWVGCDDF